MFRAFAPFTRPTGLNLRLTAELRRPTCGSWKLRRINSEAPATWRDFHDGTAVATRTVEKDGVEYLVECERFDPTDKAEQGLGTLYGFALLFICLPLGLLIIWLSSLDQPLKTRLRIKPVRHK